MECEKQQQQPWKPIWNVTVSQSERNFAKATKGIFWKSEYSSFNLVKQLLTCTILEMTVINWNNEIFLEYQIPTLMHNQNQMQALALKPLTFPEKQKMGAGWQHGSTWRSSREPYQATTLKINCVVLSLCTFLVNELLDILFFLFSFCRCWCLMLFDSKWEKTKKKCSLCIKLSVLWEEHHLENADFHIAVPTGTLLYINWRVYIKENINILSTSFICLAIIRVNSGFLV